MKNLLCLFLAMFIAFSMYAQDDKTEISATAESYYQAMYDGERVTFFTHLPPELFTMLSKKKYYYHTTGAKFNNDNWDYYTKEFSVSEVSQVLEVDEVKYAVVTLSITKVLDVHYTAEIEQPDEKWESLKGLFSKVSAQEGGIIINEEDKTIISDLIINLFAVKKPLYDGWKLVSKGKYSKKFYKKVVPKEVIKHFEEN